MTKSFKILVSLVCVFSLSDCKRRMPGQSSSVKGLGRDLGALKGHQMISNNIKLRMLDAAQVENREFAIYLYLATSPSNKDIIRPLLGEFRGVGESNEFVNGEPTPITTLLWNRVLTEFSKKIAQTCNDGSDIIGYPDGFNPAPSGYNPNGVPQAVLVDVATPQGGSNGGSNGGTSGTPSAPKVGYKMKAEFVEAVRQICSKDPRMTDQGLAAIWRLLVSPDEFVDSGDSSEEAKAFMQYGTQLSQNMERSKFVASLLTSAMMNHYFLMNNK